MLSGDIGSGKSTILLSIEFALFGLLRGELSGNALLRSGTQSGSIELTFEADGKQYTIKRTLKRSKTSVEQSAGYIIADGIKYDATAIELKSKIIELLGYPQDLLTKSKNFVYRYTVYTPQEDMKRILQESPEQRLTILRRVFDIDKYARIKQNAAVYSKALRERKRALDLILLDLNDKKKQLDEEKNNSEKTKKELNEITPKIELLKQQISASKEQLSEIEKKKSLAEDQQRKIQVMKTQISMKEQQQKNLAIQIEQSKQQTKIELPAIPDLSIITEKQNSLTAQINQTENIIRELTSTTAEINTRKKYSEETVQKITSLDHCPTCLQDVTDEHKHSIIHTEKTKITDYEQKHSIHNEKIKSSYDALAKLKTELDAIRKQQQETSLLKLKHQHMQDSMKRQQQIEEQHSKISQEIILNYDELTLLEKNIIPCEQIKNEYQKLRLDYDRLSILERELSIKHSALLQKEENSKLMLQKLQEEIERKEKAKNKLEETQKIHQWITDFFTPLMDTIEKHVMGKIHHEFNALFQQWFGMLVEDLMSARLDETYTPIVQQNGYDIEVENLSGGERTACALAYRLALNKTINSLINTIKTKDLLILDEPTEGFSTEQLDKMREVLSQLHLKQIIIVSHEQKVEGFADHVLRVQKEGHVSEVLTQA